MAKVTRSPLNLQQLCSELTVDSALWSDLPEISLPADTYRHMEKYVKNRKEWSRTLRYLYMHFYKNSDIKMFDLSGIRDEHFINILNLEVIVRLDLSDSKLPKESYVRIVTATTNVQFLNLTNCKTPTPKCDRTWPPTNSLIGNETFIAIAQHCRKLVELNLSGAQIDFTVFVEGFSSVVDGRKAFSELKTFFIPSLNYENKAKCWAKCILENSHRLENVNQPGCMEYLAEVWLDKGMFRSVCANPYAIKTFGEVLQWLPECEAAFFKDLKLMCPMLTELHLAVDGFEDVAPFKRGDLLPNLHHLELRMIYNRKPHEVEAKKEYGQRVLNVLEACGSNLHSLKLRQMSYVRCVDVLRLCPKLKELTVDDQVDSRFGDGINDATPVFLSLEKFSASSDWIIMRETMKHNEFGAVIKLFPNLIKLEMAYIRIKENILLRLFRKGSFARLEECSFENMVISGRFLAIFFDKKEEFPMLRKLTFSRPEYVPEGVESDDFIVRKAIELRLMAIAHHHGLQHILDINMGLPEKKDREDELCSLSFTLLLDFDD